MGDHSPVLLMRAVVLGACGAVGREVSAGLAASGPWTDIRLVDVNRPGLRELAGALSGPVSVRRTDVSRPQDLRSAIRDAAVAVNCTSYRMGVQALRAAIAERVHYLDLGGLYNTPRQLAMDARARKAGIHAVIGCGATPGLSNILVRRSADRLDRVTEVHISFASHRDLAPSPGLLDTLLDEFRPDVPRFTWRDGELRSVAPFEGERRIRFPAPVGEQQVYYVPHSETYTLPASLGDGLRGVAVRGTWRPEDMRALASLARLGLTRDRPVRVGGARVRPIEVVRAALLAEPPRSPSLTCAFFLDVEVSGDRDGVPVTIRHRASHPASWGTEATGRMTAIPAVVGATLVATGRVAATGVLPPERAFEPRAFVAAVRRAGVRISSSERAGQAGSVP